MLQAKLQNQLLRYLSPSDYALLQPHLFLRLARLGEVLIDAGERIEALYFPEDGIVSYISPNNVETEIGIIGREGVVGVPVLLGVERTPLKSVVQVAGRGYGISVPALLDAIEQSRSLPTILYRYIHILMMQAASSAYANSYFTIEQRLARWLLMTHDRVDTDELVLTHDYLALMLCVRRPGVTVATHILEGNGLIRAKRGRIVIRDRDRLKELAEDGYGQTEAEYARVFGSAHPRTVSLNHAQPVG